MVNIITDLIFLTLILVIITDMTDWPFTVKKVISWLLTKGKLVKTNFRFHLVDCSLCQVTWCGIIYLLIKGALTLETLYYVLLLAIFTVPIKNLLQLIIDAVNTFIAKLSRKL